jgi:hypothetical protein
VRQRDPRYRKVRTAPLLHGENVASRDAANAHLGVLFIAVGDGEIPWRIEEHLHFDRRFGSRLTKNLRSRSTVLGSFIVPPPMNAGAAVGRIRS